MTLMDEVAFIAATWYARKKVVTVSSDRINFDKAIPAGTIDVRRYQATRHYGDIYLALVAIDDDKKTCKDQLRRCLLSRHCKQRSRPPFCIHLRSRIPYPP